MKKHAGLDRVLLLSSRLSPLLFPSAYFLKIVFSADLGYSLCTLRPCAVMFLCLHCGLFYVDLWLFGLASTACLGLRSFPFTVSTHFFCPCRRQHLCPDQVILQFLVFQKSGQVSPPLGFWPPIIAAGLAWEISPAWSDHRNLSP